MELNPFKLSRNAAWYTLNKTGMNGLAQAAIHCFVPSRQVQDLLQSQAERLKRREKTILRGFGEIEIQFQKGLVSLDDSAREQYFEAVKSVTPGVKFSDVFDPHAAKFLEISTSGGAQPEKVSPMDGF